MTHTLIRRWKILISLTWILTAATVVLMFLRFNPIHIILLFMQAVLLATQYTSLKMLKEVKEQAA